MNDTVPNDMGAHGAVHMDVDPNAPAPAAVPTPAPNADGTTPAAPTVPSLPEGGHEKFYDASTGNYNWEAHAREQAFQMQQAQQRQTPAQTPQDPQQEAPVGDDSTAQTAVEAAGLDWDQLSTQVVEHGMLTDDQYDRLEQVGIPREDVQRFVEFRHQEVQKLTRDVVEGFGGEQGFAQMQQWAVQNLSEAEMEAYNTQLNGPAWRVAVDTLRARAGMAPASQGAPVQAPNQAGAPSSGAAGYQSEAEMVAEMRDPRYKTDPAFRQQVMLKAQASQFTTNPRAHTAGI